MQNFTIDSYRKTIQANTGKQISLTLKKGRKYITLNECIIENAYERIFTVKIIGESLIKCNTISVCYADLITGNARILMKKLNKEA